MLKHPDLTSTILAAALMTGCILGMSWHTANAAGARVRSASSVLLDQHGNGISNTRKFRAPGEWRINYSFSNCQIPGFSIYVKGGPGDILSVGGNSGHGVQYEHAGGRVYLTTNTACSWHITAIAGGRVVAGPGLKIRGNGIANSVKFRVPSDWKINYGFSHCQIPGFAIYVKGDVDDIMSRGGKSGHGVQYEHSGGTVYLSMNTACSWRIAISR